jgi:hypothetical protein
MGFTSHDDLMQEITVNGHFLRTEFQKIITPADTAGGWRLLAGMAGTPVATTWPGTTLLWKACDELSGESTNVFGIQNGGAVSTDTKHVVNASVLIGPAAAGAPWLAMLVDLQGYYLLTGADVTGTAGRTLINANTFTASSSTGLLLTYTNDFSSGTVVYFTTTGALPIGLALATPYWLTRISATTAKVSTSYANYVAGTFIAYTDGGSGTNTMTIRPGRYPDGAGLRAFYCTAGVLPTAGGPNLTASAYTNSAGTGSRAFQPTTGTVPNMGATADAYLGRVLHTGNAAGRYGPFLPLMAGDAGVQSVQSFTWSGGTAYTGTGTVALCLVRPLLTIPVPVSGVAAERDLVNQLPSMPQVCDGACLTWMIFSTGATTTLTPIYASVDVAWG